MDGAVTGASLTARADARQRHLGLVRVHREPAEHVGRGPGAVGQPPRHQAAGAGLGDRHGAHGRAEQRARDQLVESQGPDRLSISTRRAGYVEQLDQLRLSSGLSKTGGARIVSDAVPSSSPFKPAPRRSVAIALVLATMWFSVRCLLNFDRGLKAAMDRAHAERAQIKRNERSTRAGGAGCSWPD